MQDLEGRDGTPHRCLLSSAGKQDGEVWRLCSMFQNPVTSILDAQMWGQDIPLFFPAGTSKIDVVLETTVIMEVTP